MQRKLSWLLLVFVALGSLIGGACTNGGTSQPQGNTGVPSGGTAASPGTTSPVSPVTPTAPKPSNSVPSTPAQSNQSNFQPPPDTTPAPSDSLDASAIITKPASQMTLTLADMGSGWTQGNAIAPALQQVTSSSHVYYTQGSSFAPGVQNTVAVYRSIDIADSAYAKEKQANLSTSNPAIGDECLLNDSVPINKVLIFRKNNVVVWLWMKQYKDGDIEHYARIVEQRITSSAPLPAPPGPSSQTVSTPPPQTPVETPGDLQPAINQPTDGLITKQAYEMVLTKEDMGTGWIKGNISPPADTKSVSSSNIYYSQGSSFGVAVQNTVAVYHNVQQAADVYANVKQSGADLSHPTIGDECFLNNSVAIDRLLVFRKGNVVVWIWLQQYKTGDIEGYARIVEKKITP